MSAFDLAFVLINALGLLWVIRVVRHNSRQRTRVTPATKDRFRWVFGVPLVGALVLAALRPGRAAFYLLVALNMAALGFPNALRTRREK